ncbi:MAG: septal ring lytic transglycosylase RlpA family protein [Fodinibius sp.]|nr:septal ring lytic transglycosylase RlpA family protein [Fodinibius sp.]
MTSRAFSASKGQKIEEGMASWYGPNFHGKLTANGEKYDMYGLTAAHRTLPFNTVVKVKNLDNGESVQVRINDRGPYAKNRIIDLSKKAANKINMLGPGTARVSLILMEGDLENARNSNLKVPTYTVQLASFSDETKAFAHSREIRGSRVEKVQFDGQTVYRVYYGNYVDKDNARTQQRKLARRGYDGYVKQIQN